ncbi:hypothetical protein G6F22_020306 [Rhizopus arrhizus]|nr:hypothetical protein G6F22_020306 [Rhizopus arrhizus]
MLNRSGRAALLCRWCRTAVRRARPAVARPPRGRGSSALWLRKNTHRSAGRYARAPAPRGHRTSAARRGRGSAATARRWRCGSAGRWRGPRPRWSRAGW